MTAPSICRPLPPVFAIAQVICTLLLLAPAGQAESRAPASAPSSPATRPLASADTAPVQRVLILGNSITRHPPKPSIGWTNDWGMAASSADRDYAHLFLNALAARTGHTPDARIRNIAEFEQHWQTYPISDKLKDDIAFGADLVVVAIGENVPSLPDPQTQAQFAERLGQLLAAVKHRPQTTLLVRSSFWPNHIKDEILKRACTAAGGIFVDISPIGRDETSHARSERHFDHAGVAAHPGDKGMQAIAAALLSACPTQPPATRPSPSH